MWEDYLAQATRPIRDKYQARRIKAEIRHQLLQKRQTYMAQGWDSEQALMQAMRDLGDPEVLGRKLSLPIRQQHGWLWLFSVAQLLVGVGMMIVSLKTEAFADLALGRMMALWGGLATGIQTLRIRDIRHHLVILRWRMHEFHEMRSRGFFRMMGVGGLVGVALALVTSLPWNFVNANMAHPVLISFSAAFLLAWIVTWVPWVLARRFIGPRLYWVTSQGWAALLASVAYTAMVEWHQAFAPPPLFNWPPAMLLVGSWVFNFLMVRAVAAVTALWSRSGWGYDESSSSG